MTIKKIIETVLAEVWQTWTKVPPPNRPLAIASNVAPNAPTAPASDGVAHPSKIDPLISVIRNTGGRKLRAINGHISLRGTFNKLAGSGGAISGFTADIVATKIR